MNLAKTILAAAVAATACAVPAMAQNTDFQLPEQCTSSASGEIKQPAGHGGMHGGQGGAMGPGMTGMIGMGGVDLESMPEHVQENMRRMMISMPAMHQGMMIEDADVAFACGMIAHHQGAIDMAEVLLEHGDNPEMRELADEIIAAQVGEIERMTMWLADNAN
jgi:hypothetical protein